MLPQLMFLQPPTPTHPCTAGSGLPEAGNALQGDGLPGEGDPRGLPEKQQGLGQDAGHLAATAVTLCTCTPACTYTCLCKWLGRNHIAYVHQLRTAVCARALLDSCMQQCLIVVFLCFCII